MMDETLRTHLAQLIEKWRADAKGRARYGVSLGVKQPHGHHILCSDAMARAECADDLAALLAVSGSTLPTIEEMSGFIDKPTGDLSLREYLEVIRGDGAVSGSTPQEEQTDVVTRTGELAADPPPQHAATDTKG